MSGPFGLSHSHTSQQQVCLDRPGHHGPHCSRVDFSRLALASVGKVSLPPIDMEADRRVLEDQFSFQRDPLSGSMLIGGTVVHVGLGGQMFELPEMAATVLDQM